MNYEEISEHILAELECSLEELESLENREQLERQGIDVQNDIERYSALIDSFKLMVEKAKAFDEICKAHVPLEKRMSPVTVDEGLYFAVETEKIILKFYEGGESK